MAAEDVGVLKRTSWILNVIFHQGVAVVIVFILCTVFANAKVDALATWHMVLTPTGFMLLMMESLILFTKSNIPTLHIPRAKKRYVHITLQVLSTILITTGIAFRIKAKQGTHFNTTHGMLGLSAWIVVWCSVLGGIATTQSHYLKTVVKPVWIKLCHTIFGLTGFTLGIVTLGYGMKEYLVFYSSENIIIAAIVTIGLLYGCAIIDPVKSIFNQIRSIVNK